MRRFRSGNWYGALLCKNTNRSQTETGGLLQANKQLPVGSYVPYLNCRRKYKSINKAASSQLARGTKAIVVLAFRNGPIENVTRRQTMSNMCWSKAEYSHITQQK